MQNQEQAGEFVAESGGDGDKVEAGMPMTIAYLHTSHVLIPMFTDLSKREMPG